MNRKYWLNLFTGSTWLEFQKAGSRISGFRESRWKTMQKIDEGDYLLCYLSGASRFVGLLEVVSKPFKNEEKDIWKEEHFPCRINVRPIVLLTPEEGIPVFEMKNELSCFKKPKGAHGWTASFVSSPQRWNMADGKAVFRALLKAQKNPNIRPIAKGKLKYRPPALRTKTALATVSDANGEESKSFFSIDDVGSSTEHTEIQWRLLQLGQDMGFDIWVARNDKGKKYNGKRISEFTNIKKELPLQFDAATTKAIELIDVLWLKGNAITAAFEIESTTSIYSGLLRMADLIAMQPNLNIPLYLVAPDERRERVITEVNRPTFRRLNPPLSQICRFISFSSLKDKLSQTAAFVSFLRPEFLNEISESCELDKA